MYKHIMVIYFQSMMQVLSIPVTYISHGFHLPSKQNIKSRLFYCLPFEGSWSVVNGGVDKSLSHSWGIPPQRYAYDFLIIDENGKSYNGDGKLIEDYYCYGGKIIAPADGEVVKIGDKCPDSRLYQEGTVDYSIKDIRGNYITLWHNDHEYSTIAHIMPNSILVSVGQKVKQGDVLARCGNSGNSSEPHIHFQIHDRKSFFLSAGLPIRFRNIRTMKNKNHHLFDPRPIADEINGRDQSYKETEVIFIHRGEIVENIKSGLLAL